VMSEYREKYGIDLWVSDRRKKLKLFHDAYKLYTEYVTSLQKAKKMDYFNR